MPGMSYVVLARKYRPRSFAQMVGQEHVVQALTNALTQACVFDLRDQVMHGCQWKPLDVYYRCTSVTLY